MFVMCANSYRYVCEQVNVGEVNGVLGEYFAELNRCQEEDVVVVNPPVASPVKPTQRALRSTDIICFGGRPLAD